MGNKNAPNAYFIELTKTLSSNWLIIFLDIHSGIKFGNPKIEEKINKVNDNQLKGSLNSLLKAYNERNR